MSESLISTYPGQIAHLYQQHKVRKRLGLIFGSGLSTSSGILPWRKIIDRIASHLEFPLEFTEDPKMPTQREPYLIELLYRHYCEKYKYRASIDTRAKWHREMVRPALYGATDLDIGGNFAANLASHPYLKEFQEIVREIPSVITYNFDDLLERTLRELDRQNGRAWTRHETVTNLSLQRRESEATICHPNGFLPSDSDPVGDTLVFSEETFGGSESHSDGGVGVLSYLLEHTTLWVGLSLNDDILRRTAMRAARIAPGNLHYYALWMGDNDEERWVIDEAQKNAIRTANLEVYNLATMFLTSDEIGVLGKMLSLPPDVFEASYTAEIRSSRRFYITGPPKVGKSTVLRHLGSFDTCDEFVYPPPPDIKHLLKAVPISPSETVEGRRRDDYLFTQFHLKNNHALKYQIGSTVFVRTPLDPLLFAADEYDRKMRSELIEQHIMRASKQQLAPGHVVVLYCSDYGELEGRAMRAGSHYRAKQFMKIQEGLEQLYPKGHPGVTWIDSRRITPSQVAHRIASMACCECIVPEVDLNERLRAQRQ